MNVKNNRGRKSKRKIEMKKKRRIKKGEKKGTMITKRWRRKNIQKEMKEGRGREAGEGEGVGRNTRTRRGGR